MDQVQMKSLKPHRYGSAQLQAGDVFPASSRHVSLLKALGRAMEAETGSVEEEVSSARPANKAKAKLKGNYNRRDMRARS